MSIGEFTGCVLAASRAERGIALDRGSAACCGVRVAGAGPAAPWRSVLRRESSLKRIACGIAVSSILTAAPALAQQQDVNLTGRYQCIQNCVAMEPGRFAFVTQNGREMNLVNEVGM